MKKTYITPQVRTIVLTETDAVLLGTSGRDADPTSSVLSRRQRQDEWEEEEEDLIDMLLMQQNKK